METSSTCTLTVGELVTLFNEHAEKRYRRRDGSYTREHKNFASVLKLFQGFAGERSLASKINRHQVRAWLDQLAASELSRSYVNQCLTKLRTFVRWCADLEHVPLQADHELRLVKPLQPFRTRARESEKRIPVSLSELARVRSFLGQPWRDVCQLQELTGCRPGEILGLLNGEVHLDDRARLCPIQHKTAHKGKSRVIPLTSAAVAIVERRWRPFLPADPLFLGGRRKAGGTPAPRGPAHWDGRQAGRLPHGLLAHHDLGLHPLEGAEGLLPVELIRDPRGADVLSKPV